MILLAGGTGRLGGPLATRMVGRGEIVRVLSRRRPAEPRVGVEYVLGDVRDPATLTAAVRDCQVVVSAIHGFAGPGRVTPASVDRDGNVNLVNAAGRAGADVVLMSVVGASPTHELELFRMKAAAEESLRRSGVGWTIVRSTAFAELHLDLLRGTAKRTGRPLVFGRGRNPINFVSVNDVAAAVDLAVVDQACRGRILEVGGPQNLTMDQLAAVATDSGANESGANESGANGSVPGGSVTSRGEPRHVPLAVLRLFASTGRLVQSQLSRQTAAAVVMDTTDMRFDATELYRAYPQLPRTVIWRSPEPLLGPDR